MRLRPREERPPVGAVIAQLNQAIGKVPGMRVFMQVPPPIRIGGRLTKSQYQLVLEGSDPHLLYEQAPRLAAEMEKVPGLTDVTTDLQIKNPQLQIDIDRDRAASLGVTTQQIEDALYSAYGSRQVSTIFAPSNAYQVVLELLPSAQRRPAQLERLYVRSSRGDLVPLGALAKVTEGVGPLSVNHAGQLSAVTVSFNVEPGFGLSDATSAVQETAHRVLPGTVATHFQGAAEAFQASLSGLGMLLVVSIFVIYLVLGILYESFIHPLTILSALPFAGFGALVTLQAFHIDLNVYSFVGLILLVGLVKKNGIMMVDFALDAQRSRNEPAAQAIHEASVIRFRPIMMTTFAALFGTLPIALGLGAGAESRQPLGIAVVGGLLFSQFFTLYVTPVFYTYSDQLRAWSARRRGSSVTAPAGDSHATTG
jgi:HAE1 family hydrophobic/amphiphilic exporter-1